MFDKGFPHRPPTMSQIASTRRKLSNVCFLLLPYHAVSIPVHSVRLSAHIFLPTSPPASLERFLFIAYRQTTPTRVYKPVLYLVAEGISSKIFSFSYHFFRDLHECSFQVLALILPTIFRLQASSFKPEPDDMNPLLTMPSSIAQPPSICLTPDLGKVGSAVHLAHTGHTHSFVFSQTASPQGNSLIYKCLNTYMCRVCTGIFWKSRHDRLRGPPRRCGPLGLEVSRTTAKDGASFRTKVIGVDALHPPDNTFACWSGAGWKSSE